MKPNPRARLLVELPAERYRLRSPDGRAPRVGDMLLMDQAFTGADGRPMVLVYFPDFGCDAVYEADVYEWELG